MQSFINKECYVVCKNNGEVMDFLDLCREYGLQFTDRLTTHCRCPEMIRAATFAYNLVDDSDGVSYWTGRTDGGDRKRTLVNFEDLVLDLTHTPTDVSDFLDML